MALPYDLFYSVLYRMNKYCDLEFLHNVYLYTTDGFLLLLLFLENCNNRSISKETEDISFIGSCTPRAPNYSFETVRGSFESL